MKTLALYNSKGGVGKTTAAVQLAALAAESGRRTLLLDLDAQGAASYILRVQAEDAPAKKRVFQRSDAIDEHIRGSSYELLDVVPADASLRNLDRVLSSREEQRRGRLKALLRPLRDHYDLIVIDCPPSLSLAAENVFRATDLLLIPTIPTLLSERTLEQVLAFLTERGKGGPRVLPFFSMVDRRRSLHREAMERLRGKVPQPLNAEIPMAAAIEKMVERREPLCKSAPLGAANLAFRALWDEIAEIGLFE